MKKILCIVFFILSSSAWGIDIYRFFTKDCNSVTGILVHVEESASTKGNLVAHILTLDGREEVLNVSLISRMSQYKIHETPASLSDILIKQVKAKTKSIANQSYLYRVVLSYDADYMPEFDEGIQERSFFGYAIAFDGDVIVFLDIFGKLHIIEVEHIQSIHSLLQPTFYEEIYREIFGQDDAELNQSSLKGRKSVFRGIVLRSPPGWEECGSYEFLPKRNAGDGASIEHLPSAVQRDSFKIISFFNNGLDGYRRLKSLAERTSFYPKPIVFDTKSRLGIPVKAPQFGFYNDAYGISPENQFPFYIVFGGGKPYRFQSHFSFGSLYLHPAPFLRGIFGVESSFKSHLIHGVFVGNLSNMTAGRTTVSQLFFEGDKLDSKRSNRAPWGLLSFNHMTLLGVDYGPWGLSFGAFYPTFGLGIGEDFREVTTNTVSQVFRISHTQNRARFEQYIYKGSAENSLKSDGSYGFSQDLWFSSRFVPKSMNFKLLGSKTSLLFDLSSRLFTYLDFLIMDVSYEENAQVRVEVIREGATSLPELQEGVFVKNTLRSQQAGFRSGIRYDFGRWMALRGDYLYDHVLHKAQFEYVSDPPDSQRKQGIQTMTVTMEVLL